MAGNLLSSNMLTVKETVLTIITAQVLSSIIFTIRHSTPYYIGIFGSRMGSQIMLASTMLRNAVNVAGIFVLYFLW